MNKEQQKIIDSMSKEEIVDELRRVVQAVDTLIYSVEKMFSSGVPLKEDVITAYMTVLMVLNKAGLPDEMFINVAKMYVDYRKKLDTVAKESLN